MLRAIRPEPLPTGSALPVMMPQPFLRVRVRARGVWIVVLALVGPLTVPVFAQQRARPNNGASVPVRSFPNSIFNLPTRTNGSGVLKLPPTPPAPPPKKAVPAPKAKPVYAKIIAARTAKNAAPKKAVTKKAKTKKRRGGGGVTVTTEPADTSVPEAFTPPVDPVTASSGQCSGVNSVALAPQFLVNFNVEAVDPSSWCQLLAGDANRMLRFAPEVHLDWPSLATNKYFTDRVPGVGRDAIVHRDASGEWSEFAVLLPGGRLFIASSVRGAEDAQALAQAAQDLSAPVDPVALSTGDCPGPITGVALAGLTRQVFRYDAGLEGERGCLLVSENGLIQVSVKRDPVNENSALRVDDTYWKEYEQGVGRSALYHAPSGPEDLHGVGFLHRQFEFDVFTPSREQSRALALDIVRTV